MKKGEFGIDIKNIPDYIQPSYEMSEPNENIVIHAGEFNLANEDDTLTLHGEVFLQWLPNFCVKFSGEVIDATEPFSLLQLIDKEIELRISDSVVKPVYLSKVSLSEKPLIEGRLESRAIIGDKTVPVDKIRFSIPNLRELQGENTKRKRENGYTLFRSRIHLISDRVSIKIDRVPDFEAKIESLSKNGGFIILYGGEITISRKSLTFNDLKEIHSCLSSYLAFLNGRKCSPILYQGIFEGEVVWTDYSKSTNDPYKVVETWPQAHSTKGLSDLWKSFNRLWQDKSDKDFLKSAIHWYTESNSNAGYIEGSIILAQITLELIYNWLVIEKRHVICGKDAASISAANKVRLLLSQVNGDAVLPASFKNLENHLSSHPELNDGVDIIVQIRNAIVHAQQDQRLKLIKTDAKVKYEARQLALWYIEYSLLFLLEFNGKYFNRTSGKEWGGDGEEESPFITQKT